MLAVPFQRLHGGEAEEPAGWMEREETDKSFACNFSKDTVDPGSRTLPEMSPWTVTTPSAVFPHLQNVLSVNVTNSSERARHVWVTLPDVPRAPHLWRDVPLCRCS